MMRALIAIGLLFIAGPGTTAKADAKVSWLEEEPINDFFGHDVHADFNRFLGDAKDYPRSYRGHTREGAQCAFSIEDTAEGFRFTPEGGTASFAVPRGGDINGGFQGNRLWASYFIDRTPTTIHGQFGKSFRLELERNDRGELTRFLFRYSQVEDLTYDVLTAMECLELQSRN